MESRPTPHEGSALTSASHSGNVTPQNASMELDTLPSGHIQSSRKLATGNNDSEKDAIAKLSKNLAIFAQNVTETASATILRDMARARIIKAEMENKKWESLRVDYTSLAEEQAKAVKNLKETADRVDEKLSKFRQAQDEAIKAVAASMVSVSSGTTSPSIKQDNGKVKLLEAEVKDLKSGLKTVNSSLESSKRDLARSQTKENASGQKNPEFRDFRIDPDNLRNQLGQVRAFQSKLDLSEKRIAYLEHDYKKIERSKASSAEIDDVQKHVARLQEQFDFTKFIEDDLNDLQTKVSSLSQSVQQWRQDAVGTREGNTGNTHEGRITRLEEDITEINRELNAQIEKVNIETARIASVITANQADVSLRLESTMTEVAQVAKDLAAVIRDQETKDNLVAQEVERLDQTISAVNTDLSKLQADHIKMRAELAEISTNVQLKQTAASEQTLTNSTHTMQSQQPDITEMSAQDGITSVSSSNTQSSLLAEYNDRLITCETVLTSLLHRFDNLSTAELAKNMVNQMTAMYPYPAQVLAQLEQVGRNYNALLQTVANISGNYSTLSRRVDALSSTTQTQSQDNAATSLLLLTNTHDVQIKTLETRLTDLSLRSAIPGNSAELASKTEVDSKTASLEGQIAAVQADLKETALGLKDINKVLDVAKIEYESTVNSLQSDILNVWEAMMKKPSATEHDALKSSFEADITRLESRLNEKEDGAIEELARMNERLTNVMRRLGMPYPGLSQEPESGDDRTDNRNIRKSAATSASPAVTLGQPDEPMSEEDSDPVRKPLLGRSILTKKKDHKRKRRSKSSDSESNLKRKTKTGL